MRVGNERYALPIFLACYLASSSQADNYQISTFNANPVVTTITSTHPISSGPTPSIAVGSGAGTGGSVGASITGHDTAFVATVTTGSSTAGATNQTVATITFGTPYGTTPIPTMQAASISAMSLAGNTSYSNCWPQCTTTTCVITSGATALTANTTYVWNIHIQQ
jgi:hypothetical protein